ncbi:hypothetical protein IW138_003618 [Coemansia sp. RSA 986]|nr:hypothetical protein IW138_003618 [Coemansia sp. RSA 986]
MSSSAPEPAPSMPNTQYRFSQLRRDSTAQEQAVWIESIDIVHRNDPNLLATSIFVAVDPNIIADFSAWVRQDASRSDSWASLKMYLTTVRHPRDQPVDLVDELVHMKSTGTIEKFNEQFRQTCQAAGGTEDSPFSIGIYRALMPQDLRQILIRQQPKTLTMAMQLCKDHIQSVIRAARPSYGEPMEIDAMEAKPFTEWLKKTHEPVPKKGAPGTYKDRRQLQTRVIDEARKRGIADEEYYMRRARKQCVFCSSSEHRAKDCSAGKD